MSALDRPVADVLRELVAEVSGRPPEAAEPDSSVWDLGLDSLRQMILVARLQAAGYATDFAELSSAGTFGEWCRLIDHTSAVQSGENPSGLAVNASAEGADETLIPFTPMQTAYWLGRDPELSLGGKAAQYYVEFDQAPESAACVDGTQFVERLRAAVHRLGERHALLRARVVPPDRLEIGSSAGWAPTIDVFDERDLAQQQLAVTLRQRRADWARRVLDVRAGEMIALAVSLLPANRLRVHLVIDMLIADGESFSTLLGELSLLVREPGAGLGAVPPSFRQAADWCRRQPTEMDRRFWSETVEKLPLPPSLLSGASDSPAGADPIRRQVWIEPRRRELLEQFAAAQRTTVSAVVATVYAEIVARWSGVQQFSLNIPVSLRSDVRDKCAGTVGDFTDFALVAVDLALGDFADRCRALHGGMLSALCHRGVSGPQQLRMLSRREGQAVTAPVVFTSMLGMGELYSPQVRGALGDPVWTSSQIPQVLLDCQVLDDQGGFTVNWDTASGAIADQVFDAMFEAFVTALQGLADDARAVSVAVPAEQMAARLERRSAVPRADRPLFADFLRQASVRPEAIAVVCGSEQISYGELRARSLRLAGSLAEAPAHPVAVCLPKGIDQVVAVLGVALSGSAYVPISPGQPVQRRDEMLRASGARIAIVPVSADRGGCAAGWPAAVVPLSLPELLNRPGASVELGAVDAGAPAYVIFTSGSTGPPKGVVMSHRAVMNTLDDVRRRFGLDQRDRVLGFSQLDFDLSVYDIFATLGAGGVLVLPEESVQLEPAELRTLCVRHEVTVWNSVPALFDMVLTAGQDVVWPSLRLVLLSGDWIATELPDRIRGSGVRIIGMGGATEAGIWSNYFDATASDLSGWMSVPYGAPLRNQAFRVVGPDGTDCPDWVAGELLIGGDSLADGYLADSDLTARKFATDGPDRWYRTGDFGRYRTGGLLEFLGRRDDQVKVGGFRIELGEIEAACRRCEGVIQAAAVVAGQRKQSIVVFVTGTDVAPDPAGLLTTVGDQLPAYMAPRRMVVLDELPRTANDKVDRAALVRLGTAVLRGAPSSTGGPDDPVLALVKAAWHEVSGQRGAMDENFFRLGGDSLSALRLLDLLERRGLTGGRLRRLVESATMADFAASLSLGPRPAFPAHPELRPDAEIPLTQVQRAYLSGERSGSRLGGIPALSCWEFSSIRRVDADQLGRAVAAVVRRHPVLRADITETGFRISPPDRDPDPAPVLVTDPDGFRHWQDAARQLRSGERRRPLDVAVCRDAGGDRVGLVLDHLYFDAVSAMTVMNDLGDIYSGSSTDVGEHPRPIAIPARVRPGDRAFWESRLLGIPPAPVLPTTMSPAAVDRPRFARRSAQMGPAEWRQVQDAAARLGSSATGVLLTAFGRCVLVNSEAPAGTIVVTTFDSLGSQPGDREAVGDRTELLLLSFDAVGNNFARDVTSVTAGLADALDHRTMSGLAVMAELALRDQALGPAVVFTSAVGLPRRREPLRQSFGTYSSGVSQTPQTVLDCQVLESGDGLLISFDFVEQLLSPEYVDGLVESMLDQLHALAAGRDPGPPATVPLTPGTAYHDVPGEEASVVIAGDHPHSVANDETRTLVLELWSRMLGQPVTAADDFFDIGGDSLVAARTAAAIHGRIGVEIGLGEVVRCRTADRLAVLVGGRQAEADMVSGAV
ncbi:amino acid adenylation domain-containing protein [Kribbella sp. NPDC050820]|uniref:amino acid adenylation domain-containing protein n=1 Tax=Kribbella sp. NPDC050820 TaxID=3155408 RepID=UPI0034021A50